VKTSVETTSLVDLRKSYQLSRDAGVAVTVSSLLIVSSGYRSSEKHAACLEV
jgi:hypothetical protein